LKDFLRNGKLLTLMLGHLTVDSYVGVLPVFYPLLIGRFHLSLATVGLVSLAYGGTAAISQPLFGVIADRYGTRLTGVALGWTALTFSLAGFVPTFPLLLILVFYLLGIHGTILLVVPGLAGGGYLLWRMRGSQGTAADGRAQGAAGGAIPLLAMAVVIGVMMSRAWTVNVFQAFTPTWYRELGYGPAFYGPLATTLVLASAVGTIGCGTLADRYGRRAVIIGTLVLSVPAILLYTRFPGPWAFGSAILIGFLAASTAPLLLLMAQQLMARRAGLASGLVMGLGFITGAVGIPITGAIGDAIGLQNALMTQALLAAGTIVLAWFLPSEKDVDRLAAAGDAPASDRLALQLREDPLSQ